MLASKPGGTIYVGVTADLVRRVYEHRTVGGSEFVKKYKVTNLVWFEIYDEIEQAIVRDKQIKVWRRAWKIALIRQRNPLWDDLYVTICR